ncbi:MMPL family transporter [Cellulomonas soli]|uniref:MMPL family transporter n=1 Tax=Cellulomonas soli TaxID=931535 RepID=UPI00185641D0|nr:MMPL family transporter [Cellulomonas soli]NYI60395.1 RND superfamily putative drug exporter [Cellulomonas soli]
MLRNSSGAVLRALAVVVALGVWLGIGSVGGMAQGKLSQVQTNDAAAFLPTTAESTQAAALSAEFVETETLPALIVLEPAAGGAVTPEQIAAVQDFAAGLGDLPLPQDAGVTGTWGQYLVADPVVAPSQDGEAILVVLSLDAVAADQQLGEDGRVSTAFVTEVRAQLDEQLGATATSAGEIGLHAWVTGPAGFVADLVTAFGGIDGVLLLVALGAVLVILVLVYRSPLLPLAVIVTAVFALCLAGWVIYSLADADVIVLNGQSQGILSILVVGASVDYALLLVARYREELRHVEQPWTAMRRALRASFEPIAASAGTVIAGLLCLLLSDLASNRDLGPVAAIGIASAFLAVLTFLPALLLVGGRRARFWFWPRTPRPERADVTAGIRADVAAVETDAPGADALVREHGAWVRLARWVGAHARPVWIVTTLALALGAAFLPTLQADGTSQSDVFLTDVDSVAGEQVVADHFPAGAVQPANVIAPAEDLDAVVAAATDVPGVATVTPYTGAATGAPGSGAGEEPVVVDGNVRVDVATSAPSDSREAVATVEALREAVHAVSPDALVGGAAAQTLDTNAASASDLRTIVPAVLLVIVLILMLLLRSVVSAVVLLAANVLSFAASLGVAAVVFNHVLGFPGADPSVPLYAFVFLVALGVDYSIFLMTRVREESLRSGTRDGVVRGLAVTGGVITSAGVVLAATFAALGVIPLLFLAQLAFIVAFGVLLDTLVVRSLLVPAVVHQLDSRTWWPGRLSRPGVPGGRADVGERAEDARQESAPVQP